MRKHKNGEPGIVHRRCIAYMDSVSSDSYSRCFTNAEPGSKYCFHHRHLEEN
ncbi:hypothetical protein SEA_PERMAG_9 [Microbacterium phage PermaG]|nr:hypothetical protein SEA_PERMAG_9 [Microbacterium phage PermaG]